MLISYAMAMEFALLPSSLGQVGLQAVQTSVFYVSLLSILIMLIGISAALKQFVWTAYAVLVLIGLIYIGLLEQNISGINWSGVSLSPRALVFFGYAMASANFFTAAFAINPNHHFARVKTPLLVSGILLWVTWPIGLGLELGTAIILFNITGGLCGAAHIFPLGTFTRLQGGPDIMVRNTVSALVLLIIGAAVLVSAGFFDGEIQIISVNRVLILVITLALSFFFIHRIFAVQRDRLNVIGKSLEHATEQARINKVLLEEERRHTKTLEIVRLQNLRLATASHDIRQPIVSLRTTMAVLTKNQPDKVKAQLENAFDYLDQLAASYMDEAKEDAHLASPASGSDHPDHEVTSKTEKVSVELICTTLHRMFGAEAKDKHLQFTVTSIDHQISAQPLIIMRILSNLISNTIKHTNAGEISLAVTSKDNSVVFEVSNPEKTVVKSGNKDIFEPYYKGDNSDGQGLGLAVVKQLAESAGYPLAHSSNASTGTTFTLTIPVAD